jgi:MSHA biogenesis protein MshK
MSRILASSLAMLLAATASAQGSATLVDPTRPPSVGPAGEAVVPAGPRLQSVLISPTRRTAVISGRTVGLGARFGDATVESINEGTVVLKYANRRETLHLIPGMDKRERRVAAAAHSGPAAWEKGNPR